MSIEDVLRALIKFKKATSPEVALRVLKTAGGVSNLPQLEPGKYEAVIQAAQWELAMR